MGESETPSGPPSPTPSPRSERAVGGWNAEVAGCKGEVRGCSGDVWRGSGAPGVGRTWPPGAGTRLWPSMVTGCAGRTPPGAGGAPCSEGLRRGRPSWFSRPSGRGGEPSDCRAIGAAGSGVGEPVAGRCGSCIAPATGSLSGSAWLRRLWVRGVEVVGWMAWRTPSVVSRGETIRWLGRSTWAMVPEVASAGMRRTVMPWRAPSRATT
jgi:hypothetical protein